MFDRTKLSALLREEGLVRSASGKDAALAGAKAVMNGISSAGFKSVKPPRWDRRSKSYLIGTFEKGTDEAISALRSVASRAGFSLTKDTQTGTRVRMEGQNPSGATFYAMSNGPDDIISISVEVPGHQQRWAKTAAPWGAVDALGPVRKFLKQNGAKLQRNRLQSVPSGSIEDPEWSYTEHWRRDQPGSRSGHDLTFELTSGPPDIAHGLLDQIVRMANSWPNVVVSQLHKGKDGGFVTLSNANLPPLPSPPGRAWV
jgi:hypothetical protein